ncbi:unnamed protein product [Rotaria magnacalcarata]|uniref:Regulator of telomere elongation helicase 1 homolog n=1 Tax=Rotaria magnacalcarata TaxID=392030 RepID=A0A818W7J9_9BILA|nr:unnamed protein product [Rotaria magnacalcarata]CAF3721803.1 unnamed protein product [Rotaria magnacalcarata]
MHSYLIDGLTVLFPFEAYQCQLDYMKAVVECLVKGQNGILESPTGTGKTLSLLCATLAWLEQYKIHNSDSNEAPVQIIYASRTHSQLAQVVKEFKSTDYNRMKITVLGSRDQLCIHPEVKSLENSADKISVCREKVRHKTCLFHRNFEMSKPDITKLPPMDIEDLVKVGTQKKFCPYFAARELKEKADIIFMPYNYLLDSKARRIHKINVRKCVVIFDEAHNIEQQCEDAASVTISSLDIAACLDDITKVMKWMIESQSLTSSSIISTDDNEENNIDTNALTITQDQICSLKLKIMKLEELLDNMKITKGNIPSPGDVAFKWLQSAEIDFNPQGDLQQLQEINQFMTARSGSMFRSKGHALLKVAEFIETVNPLDENGQPCFTFDMDAQRKSVFKVYIEEESNNNEQRPSITTSKRPKKLHYWCLSPGFAMRQLCMQNTRSILLTSGTLSPIDSFQTQLAIPFDIVIQSDHIIEQNQLFAAILPRAAGNKHILTSVYRTRQNPEYQEALGQTLHNVIKNIPGGVLVFFPCYKMIEEVVQTWKNNATFETMNQRKRVIIEQRNKIKFESQMKEYNTIIENDPRGAMLFAVARGKLSEGIDFSDKSCRAVILIGIPFAPHQDRRVIAKRHYLDEINRNNKDLKAGDVWYNQQAFRAINQCVGRVIRHRRDYGAVLFFDQRFGDNTDKLSKWVRPFIHKVDFTGMMKGLKDFFAQYSSTNTICPQTTHPIQQAFFPSVTHSTTMITHVTSKSISQTISLSEDILQTTLKQSNGYSVKMTEQISSNNIRNETDVVHKSLFDAISSTRQNGIAMSLQSVEKDDKQRDFDAMLELKRREVVRTDSLSKRFLPMIGTFEETSTLSINSSTNNPTVPVSNAKASEYRELLSQLKAAMPHGVYARFTHMLQDHKIHKTDRTIFLKLQTLLVENLAKNHYSLFIDMTRHISAQFRQEYIEAGQNSGFSTSTLETQQENENIISNKRKDLSSSDLETSSPKIVKTNHSNNPFRCK